MDSEKCYRRTLWLTYTKDRGRFLWPGGLFEPLISTLFVERKVKAIFEYREKILQALFKQARFQHNQHFEKLSIHTF